MIDRWDGKRENEIKTVFSLSLSFSQSVSMFVRVLLCSLVCIWCVNEMRVCVCFCVEPDDRSCLANLCGIVLSPFVVFALYFQYPFHVQVYASRCCNRTETVCLNILLCCAWAMDVVDVCSPSVHTYCVYDTIYYIWHEHTTDDDDDNNIWKHSSSTSSSMVLLDAVGCRFFVFVFCCYCRLKLYYYLLKHTATATAQVIEWFLRAMCHNPHPQPE